MPASHTIYRQPRWFLTTPEKHQYHICSYSKNLSDDQTSPLPEHEELEGEKVDSVGSVDIFVAGPIDNMCTRVSLREVRAIPALKKSYLVVAKGGVKILERKLHQLCTIEFIDDTDQLIRCQAWEMGDDEFWLQNCTEEACKKRGKGHVSRREEDDDEEQSGGQSVEVCCSSSTVKT